MSWKATAQAKPLKAAPDGTPLSRGEKFLLFILADYHNDEQRAAWPSATAYEAADKNSVDMRA